MPKTPSPTARKSRKQGRRSPLATLSLLAVGLLFTGGAFAAFSTGTASAETPAIVSAASVEDGKKLFQANCASCHR